MQFTSTLKDGDRNGYTSIVEPQQKEVSWLMDRHVIPMNAFLAIVGSIGLATIITIVTLPSVLESVTFLPLFLTTNLNISSVYCIGIGLIIWAFLGASLGRLLSTPLPLYNKIMLTSLFSFVLVVILCGLVMLIEMLSTA